MSESRTDFELLRDFIRRSDQAAFADLVRRHLNLVYATALRKTEDPGAAEEVAQNVFAALAKKAWQFGPDDSLAAWLYRTTLLEAKEWLRGELRRRRRDQTAAELGTTMKTPDEQTAFRALLPLLDEALLSLREKERAAVLLRFYESQSLREVGATLGVTEDTAQKRVAGALEKISRFFQRRGFKTATVAAATAALQHTATSAPAATASMIIRASSMFVPPAGFTLAIAARFASLSKAQTVAACLAVAIVPLAWQWQQTRASAQSVAAMEKSLDATRTQYEQASADLKELQAVEARLVSVTATGAQTRREQAAQKLAALRARTQALLAADDYRWPEDLDFVRIPKSAVPSLNPWMGPGTPDKLQVKVQTMLGLTPQENEAVAQVFTNYFSGINHLMEGGVYETNQSTRLHLPEGAQSTVFVMQPLGPEIRRSMDELCSNITAIIGADRWALVNPDRWEMTHYEQVRLLGYFQYAWDLPQEAAVNIFAVPGKEPALSFTGENGVGTGKMPLISARISDQMFPEPLEARVREWLKTEVARYQPPTNR